MKQKLKYWMCLLPFLLLANSACKKLVDVPEPINSLTTAETFASDVNATSAVAAIYNDMFMGQSIGEGLVYSNGLITYYGGISADELTYSLNDDNVVQFQNNGIMSSNDDIYIYFWRPAYFDIYMCNAAIEGLTASTTLSQATKNQLLGETKFLRAYIYFYLVNLFGNVPLTTTSAYAMNALLGNTPVAKTYQQMIADLQSAQGLLTTDYSFSNGERIRANKWAATALLARVYLYNASLNTSNSAYYAKADSAANAVISNSGTYSLVSDLNKVFLKNSTEAILQLKPNSSMYVTWEGHEILYGQNSDYPTYDLTSNLLQAFEPKDQRLTAWTYMVNFNGINYYGPYKYKATDATASSSDIPEYYMMLRLAEQYLIRAESKAQENDLVNAIADLNTIRQRAGLPNLVTNLTQAQVLAAVAQERRIELFGEWGHRWFDLKRTGQAARVLSNEKSFPVSANALVWPIPQGEIQSDPNLKQNPGY